MKAKPVLPRQLARDDMRAAVSYYAREAGPVVAGKFADAIEIAYGRLQTSPGIGSPRYEHELGLPGVRAIGLTNFPYLIFYVEQAEYVEIWRVLHAHSDIRAGMLDLPSSPI